MKKLFSTICFLLGIMSGHAAIRYIDNTATGSNNGTSWANAWQTLNQASGASPGDTVYISGGPSGTTQTYVITSTYGNWTLANGTSGNRITYQIGQDSAHNGTVIFTRNASFGGGLGALIFQPSYVNISGDAGDGLNHFQVSSTTSGTGVISSLIDTSNQTDIHISHFTCGDMSGGFVNANVTANLEIDHCTVRITGLLTDAASFGAFSGTTWDANRIHHCLIEVPFDTTYDGWGSDCLQWNGTGYSIHDNVIKGYPLAGARGNHQDGQQAQGGGDYIKIYNNTFIDIQNYSIFLEAVSSGYTRVRIYNNIGLRTAPSTTAFIAAGVSGGFGGTPPCTFDDVVIANNLISNFGGGGYISLNNVTANAASFVNCYVYNNVFVDSTGGVDLRGNTTTTSANNVHVTHANASSYFAAYTQFNESNNYHLTATATPLIHTGTNVSSYIGTTDKDGVTWANPPSLGVYEYVSGGGDTTPPTPNPATISGTPTHTTTTISLTATTATDETALGSAPYRFSSDNGSTWTAYQSSASYTFAGLSPSTAYQVRVQYRDAAGNAGTASTAASVTTDATGSTQTHSNPRNRRLFGR